MIVHFIKKALVLIYQEHQVKEAWVVVNYLELERRSISYFKPFKKWNITGPYNKRGFNFIILIDQLILFIPLIFLYQNLYLSTLFDKTSYLCHQVSIS